ncbi:YeiH family protein [Pseudogulbenkiania sp. MAI-1]|uniref:YeiH family protein n=1 Tax=Pseudogulbenkiania sp. MAI-1 TaxID=990370 RepID=UPI0004B8E429|nr:YeiH family protein [Pseudogulbenkiania sp. MAI-1]
MHSFRHTLPGLALALLLGGGALALATLPMLQNLGLSALTLAIVGGIALGNGGYAALAPRCDAGVQFAKQRLLRLGIVLFGLRLTLQDIAAVGPAGVLIDAVMLTSTFLLACWLGPRWFGLERDSAMLIGAGSAICGAAAVLATEPVARGGTEKVAVAVATVVVFGTLAMFLYPMLFTLAQAAGMSGLDGWRFGLFAGSTLHEVAQVVAAGRAVSEQAAEVAVIAKMIRVMMLAPFLLLLSAFLARRESGATRSTTRRITIPWFAVGFVLLAGVNSLGWLPPAWRAGLLQLDTLLLAAAMAALGLHTQVSAIRRAGLAPLGLAACLCGWLIVGGAVVNAGIGLLLK